MAERQGQIVITVEDADIRAPLSWRKLMRFAGPGLLMCIAYVDPGNLEADLQTGATTGFTLLWLVALTTSMGWIIQMQAARLGVATGKNLAELCRQHYPKPASLLLWFMTEVAIIGSDVQEVIGSAIALSLLTKGHMPLWVAALVSACASFLLLLVERAGHRQLEAIFAGFVGTMVIAFGYLFWVADVSGAEVAQGFLLPQLTRAALPTAVALFGSMIMPHNIYLHSALVQSRELAKAPPAVKADGLFYFGIESGLSLLAALFINTFVISVLAKGFHKGASIPDIGLRNAGEFLGETYGSFMALVWGFGLLAAGQSSTMTGTYTGQFVMSGFLDLKVSPWARILITRTVALAPTLAVALTMDPKSTGLDKLNQSLNLLQSIQLPFALIPVLSFTGSSVLMGSLATKGFKLAAAWAVAVCVICVNMTAVAQVASTWADEIEQHAPGWVLPICLVLAGITYFGFLLFLMVASPASCLPSWRRKIIVSEDLDHDHGDDKLPELNRPLLIEEQANGFGIANGHQDCSDQHKDDLKIGVSEHQPSTLPFAEAPAGSEH